MGVCSTRSTRRSDRMASRARARSILPGFGLSLGISVLYLSLMVLIPLSTLFLKTATLTWTEFREAVLGPRALASYKLSFTASFLAALFNSVFGLIIAWALVRCRFPFRKVLDALIDLPFALSTAVAGIALTAVYSKTGWIGRGIEPLGLEVAYAPSGVVVALTFIGLPFVVRTVEPVLQDLDPTLEDAAASLGASPRQTFWRVIAPELAPALLTGFGLAFARALGEYGSVAFISGNMPMRTEITPLLIMTKLEQFDYAGATAIASVFLVASFGLFLLINLVQRRSRALRARHEITSTFGRLHGRDASLLGLVVFSAYVFVLAPCLTSVRSASV
jgi:sulfate transport system permease protein